MVQSDCYGVNVSCLEKTELWRYLFLCFEIDAAAKTTVQSGLELAHLLT